MIWIAWGGMVRVTSSRRHLPRNHHKVLGEFADRGLLRLGRGRITLLDRDGLTAENGD
jgi:hypothetical protein